MSPTMRGTRRMLAVTAAAGLALTMAACGSDDGGDAGSDGQITLKVSTFGTFGYDELYKEYEAANPNIKIVASNEGDLGKYTTALTQRIAAGSGAGDVVAIEEGAIAQMVKAADRFVNFQDHGFEAGNWVDWKNKQATTPDGSSTIGLGTDIGGLAMCYRTDLFEKAGLPTDREEVSALWPTWDDFIKVGKDYVAKAGGEAKFVDSSTNSYNSILMQEAGIAPGYTYFDTEDNLVFDSNPAVKKAWDTANAILDADLSAGLKTFTPEWDAAFKTDDFAVLGCPAWMTGNIKNNAGDDFAGKWDIATIPGGTGSWGGSFMAVPTQSKQQEEAIKLAKFLTSPEGQMSAFGEAGALPSSPKNFDNPELKDFKNEYFSDAPIGEIFIDGVRDLKPVYLGEKNQAVRDAIENDLRSVEQGQRTADEAWQQAIASAKAAAGV
ncbi:ABC transporter substrate-binding protein [Kineosporia babensis]|uniref:Extracellular solute-binding protein n=1 Tax=Kineosporia babensis TaxID=499548 RepID=A0A9X1SXE6_9ACTN|nr:extracellular solute-binding protein [Kineosporia babensis]MCD5310168.1 extracellular solute-binding protein [Kineosporia babensis]